MSTTNRTLGVLLILTAITTVLYWINYFTSADVAVVSAMQPFVDASVDILLGYQ